MDSDNREMEGVEIVRIWNGREREASELARFRIHYPELSEPDLSEEVLADWELMLTVQAEIQRLVDQRFPDFPIIVEDLRLKLGSVIVGFSLLTAGTALYVFVRDYPQLREGVLLLAKDLRRAYTMIGAKISEEVARVKKKRQEEKRKQTRTQTQGSSS